MQNRVLLIGDEIGQSYAARVRAILETDDSMKIEVVSAAVEPNFDSNKLANKIDQWLTQHKPDAVHFNAGLHDVRWYPAEQRNATDLADYEMNLQHTIEACKRVLGGDIVFATTTPVFDHLQCDQDDQDFERGRKEIEHYNVAAQQVMLAEDVLINNLGELVSMHDDEYLSTQDGISLTNAGIEAVAKTTADCVRSLWH